MNIEKTRVLANAATKELGFEMPSRTSPLQEVQHRQLQCLAKQPQCGLHVGLTGGEI
jgi:hypothetical protein